MNIVMHAKFSNIFSLEQISPAAKTPLHCEAFWETIVNGCQNCAGAQSRGDIVILTQDVVADRLYG
jgi:hypothetical protein